MKTHVIAAMAAVALVGFASAAVMTDAQAQVPDPVKAKAGEDVYNNYCATCHGDGLKNTGQTFDLRKLKADEWPRFQNSVMNGKSGRMPPWKGVVSPEELEQLWNYIRTNTTEK